MMQGPVIAPAPPGFDPNHLLAAIVPIVGFVIVVAALAIAARWVFGDALRRHRRPEPGVEGTRIAALEEQLHLLNTQVSELAERLDFAERMLAERRERTLGAGGAHGNL